MKPAMPIPMIQRIDPISIYIEFLIRQALTKSQKALELDNKDIILTQVHPQAKSKLENTVILEHRQSLPFEQLLGKVDKGPEIAGGFFKSTLGLSRNLTIKRIAGDPTNRAGWFHGRPRMFTIVTLVSTSDPMDEVIEAGLPAPMEYVMSNILLEYPEQTQGADTELDLARAMQEHRANLALATGQNDSSAKIA